MTRKFYDVTGPGLMILFAVGTLCLIGLATIYATEMTQPGTPTLTIKQIAFIGGGVVAALAIMAIGYRNIENYAYLFFFLALLMLIPPAIAKITGFDFFGFIPERRGAHRWIRLPGLQLQPSELMKIAYILGMSAYLRFRRNYRTFGGMLLPFILSGIPLVLILMEPDLGTTLLLIPIPFVMLYVAGARKKHLAIVILVGIIAAPLMWTQIRGYQRMRIVGLVLQSEELRNKVIDKPEDYTFLCTKRQAQKWAGDSGLQLLRSKGAIGSGGLLGEGWGHGTFIRYRPGLPDRHNDMIFALVGHQWGFVGCLVVLLCYVIIMLAGIEIASLTRDPFGQLLAIGVVTLLAVQTIINVGMTIGLMPITGMTLPFVSYGGSSLLSSFMAIGLLISVSQHRPYLLPKDPFKERINEALNNG